MTLILVRNKLLFTILKLFPSTLFSLLYGTMFSQIDSVLTKYSFNEIYYLEKYHFIFKSNQQERTYKLIMKPYNLMDYSALYYGNTDTFPECQTFLFPNDIVIPENSLLTLNNSEVFYDTIFNFSNDYLLEFFDDTNHKMLSSSQQKQEDIYKKEFFYSYLLSKIGLRNLNDTILSFPKIRLLYRTRQDHAEVIHLLVLEDVIKISLEKYFADKSYQVHLSDSISASIPKKKAKKLMKAINDSSFFDLKSYVKTNTCLSNEFLIEYINGTDCRYFIESTAFWEDNFEILYGTYHKDPLMQVYYSIINLKDKYCK